MQRLWKGHRAALLWFVSLQEKCALSRPELVRSRQNPIQLRLENCTRCPESRRNCWQDAHRILEESLNRTVVSDPFTHVRITKWAIWLLMLLSAALASAAPRMALGVLLPEIVQDLNLSLVKVGLIWGTETLTGIVASVLGGSLSDRYGARASLVTGCVLAGFFGLVRGFAPNFGFLLASSFLVGPFAALIPINLHKAGAQIFPLRQLAIANGGVSVGMALGFVTGAFTAATYLSPALGGWNNVMRLTGVVSMLLGLIWALLPRWTGVANTDPRAAHTSMKASILHVWGIRDVRIICLAVLGYGACVEGMLGFLPLYLRDIGWVESRADLALTTFHMASMIATIPLTLLSDYWRNRQWFLVLGSVLLASATGLTPFLPSTALFAAMLAGGMMRDAFMGIFITRLMESKGVGPKYAGGALGLAMTGLRLGGALSPPAGNALAVVWVGMPFLFWALFCVIPILVFTQLRDRQPAEVAR